MKGEPGAPRGEELLYESCAVLGAALMVLLHLLMLGVGLYVIFLAAGRAYASGSLEAGVQIAFAVPISAFAAFRLYCSHVELGRPREERRKPAGRG